MTTVRRLTLVPTPLRHADQVGSRWRYLGSLATGFDAAVAQLDLSLRLTGIAPDGWGDEHLGWSPTHRALVGRPSECGPRFAIRLPHLSVLEIEATEVVRTIRLAGLHPLEALAALRPTDRIDEAATSVPGLVAGQHGLDQAGRFHHRSPAAFEALDRWVTNAAEIWRRLGSVAADGGMPETVPLTLVWPVGRSGLDLGNVHRLPGFFIAHAGTAGAERQRIVLAQDALLRETTSSAQAKRVQEFLESAVVAAAIASEMRWDVG